MRKLAASGYHLPVTSRLALCAILCLPACSGSNSMAPMCADSGTSTTITVTVVNDTNEPMNICNAMVVATGPTNVTLTPTGGSSEATCAYSGTVTAGEYTFTATATGYQTMTAHLTVQAGCPTPLAIDVTPTM
jgi:hypothetical protein